MDVAVLRRQDRVARVQGFAEYVEQPPQAVRRHGHVQGRARVVDGHAPVKAAAAVEGDRPHLVLVDVLVHLEKAGFAVQVGPQGLAQRWEGVAGDDRHGAVDLRDHADG